MLNPKRVALDSANSRGMRLAQVSGAQRNLSREYPLEIAPSATMAASRIFSRPCHLNTSNIIKITLKNLFNSRTTCIYQNCQLYCLYVLKIKSQSREFKTNMYADHSCFLIRCQICFLPQPSSNLNIGSLNLTIYSKG